VEGGNGTGEAGREGGLDRSPRKGVRVDIFCRECCAKLNEEMESEVCGLFEQVVVASYGYIEIREEIGNGVIDLTHENEEGVQRGDDEDGGGKVVVALRRPVCGDEKEGEGEGEELRAM
jgi:hypothetical protein